MLRRLGHQKWLLCVLLVITVAGALGGLGDLPTAWAQSSSAPTKPLKLYWHPEREVAVTLARSETEQKARKLGFQFVRVEGHVFQEQVAGTVPVKLYWHPEQQVAATIASPEAEQKAKEQGYEFFDIEGYVYEQQRAGAVPLQLYWHPRRNVVVTTAAPKSEQQARERGFDFWRTEGYILAQSSVDSSLTQTARATTAPDVPGEVGQMTSAQSAAASAPAETGSSSSQQLEAGPVPAGVASHSGHPTVKYVIHILLEDLRALDSVDGDGSGADFYAKVRILDKTFNNEDSWLQDLSEDQDHIWGIYEFDYTFDVTHDGWPTDTGLFPIKLDIWDEDGGFNGGDDHIDIFPGDGRSHSFVLDVTSCSVEGNIGLIRGTFKEGICRIYLGPYSGTSNDRAEIRYRIDFYNVATFYWPRYNGLLLDLCQNWGLMCGEPAAQTWCHAYDPAYKYSVGHEVARGVGPTYVIGDNQVCNDRASCDGFKSVTCTTFDYQ